MVIAAGAVMACATSTGLDDVRFRVLDAQQVTDAGTPYLYLRGQLTNSGTQPLVSGGCLRPAIAVDSLAGSRWVATDAQQWEELVVCIRAYTVDPGGTSEFDATFSRPERRAFPVGVPLRLRVLAQGDEAGPAVTMQLSR
jgi:hypothetical protein